MTEIISNMIKNNLSNAELGHPWNAVRDNPITGNKIHALRKGATLRYHIKMEYISRQDSDALI